MSFTSIFSTIYYFLLNNQLIALGIVIGLALFWWKSPKHFFRFVIFLVVLTVLLYVLTILNQSVDTGVNKKSEITTEREEHLFK